mmetsp:Transcript_35346/g.91902  ORF Transcript_35346/g.91902 Transcript_35346/m.91902 type:complete len:118 (-) Transcript_35346:157-510(-)
MDTSFLLNLSFAPFMEIAFVRRMAAVTDAKRSGQLQTTIFPPQRRQGQRRGQYAKLRVRAEMIIRGGTAVCDDDDERWRGGREVNGFPSPSLFCILLISEVVANVEKVCGNAVYVYV